MFFFVFWGLIFQGASAKKRKFHPKKKSKSAISHVKRPVTKITGAPLQWNGAAEFQSFLQKVNQLKDGAPGHLNTLIIGDSHMQCEDFGSALRQYFVDSLHLTLAGKGFVFPYPLARTSHRSDNRFGPNQAWHGCRFTKESNACDWGLAGWTAHFQGDSTHFSWSNGGMTFRAGDTILVFSPMKCASSFQLALGSNIDARVPMEYKEAKLGYQVVVPAETRELHFFIQKSAIDSVEFVLQGIVHTPISPGLVMGISGTNGARLDHYLGNPDFARHLRIVNPDLLVISLGTNEAFAADFQKENVKQFLSNLLVSVKAAAPHAAIILMGPPDHKYVRKSNPRVFAINQIYAQTAEELDLVFWDQQKAMGGPGSIFSWFKNGLATRDFVHFTPKGYQLQAKLLGNAIKMNIQP